MALFRQKLHEPEAVVDLREPEPVKLEFGYPTPCPECSSAGYLDSIDISERVMYQHCPHCSTKWTTSEYELAHST